MERPRRRREQSWCALAVKSWRTSSRQLTPHLRWRWHHVLRGERKVRPVGKMTAGVRVGSGVVGDVGVAVVALCAWRTRLHGVRR